MHQILYTRTIDTRHSSYSSLGKDPLAGGVHRKCGRCTHRVFALFAAAAPTTVPPELTTPEGIRCKYAAARSRGADSHPFASHSDFFLLPVPSSDPAAPPCPVLQRT